MQPHEGSLSLTMTTDFVTISAGCLLFWTRCFRQREVSSPWHGCYNIQRRSICDEPMLQGPNQSESGSLIRKISLCGRSPTTRDNSKFCPPVRRDELLNFICATDRVIRSSKSLERRRRVDTSDVRLEGECRPTRVSRLNYSDGR